MVKKISLYIILVFCLFGCRPKGILHSWEMRDLLIELHPTDALLQAKGLTNNQEVKAIYYSQVLDKHGLTQSQFDSCLVWYTAHPQLFDKIYPKVVAKLQAEKDEFLALYPEFAARMRDELQTDSTIIVPAFTRRELDSIYQVTQHGYVNSWFPLSVHDTIDQFFPQIGVPSGGVVDTLQTSVGFTEITHN